MKQAKIKEVLITEIKPYWRNPRENTKAIEKVKKSIELYGYNQPIAVDKNNVIIAGHTRYKALLELGYTKILVAEIELTDQEAKAYRIADNATNQFSLWSEDLALELKELNVGEMQHFFDKDIAELVQASVGLSHKDITGADIEKVSGKLGGRFEEEGSEYAKSKKEVCCPKCMHLFYVK